MYCQLEKSANVIVVEPNLLWVEPRYGKANKDISQKL